MTEDNLNTESATRLGRIILAETREELGRADQKASILLAAVGVMVGAILAGLIPAHWSPAILPMPRAGLWWSGVLATFVGIVMLVVAVFPHLGQPSGDRHMYYFGDAASLPSREAVRDRLVETSKDELLRIADQIHVVSRIVERKYRLIQWAIWLLGAGAALTVASILPSSV